MLNDFILDKKSLQKLSSSGLSYETIKSQINGEDLEFLLEVWRSQGLKIIKDRALYYYETKFIPIEEAVFCIVDIETNGSKIDKHQIIEIGAIKIKNGVVIGQFESFVQCSEINQHITDITGISVQDTLNAPSLKQVMQDFRIFLDDAVFVAHDVKFDFKFISAMMQKVGLEPLLNRHLCSINLAERTIESYRYGLGYLNDLLSLHVNATHHRALSDAITTAKLFEKSLELIDKNVVTVEDLINFSKNERRLKRPKFDPLVKEDECSTQKTCQD
jgi:DNA polymerase-3 subunit epsilon